MLRPMSTPLPLLCAAVIGDRAVRCVVLGATGYGGAELLRHLLRHPRAQVTRTVAKDNVGKRVGDVHLNLAGASELVIEDVPATEAAADADVAFLGLPHTVSAQIGAQLLDAGKVVIDLSGDWRLRDAGAYERYYGVSHPFPARLGTWAYGMPELFREQIRTSRGVASPGCFATTITLALAPLARAGLLTGRVQVTAMTGSSGSGANASPGTHHPLRAQALRTYKVLNHQHTPEIVQALQDVGAHDLALEFVPVSAPLVRGILATSYVDVPESVTAAQLAAIYRETYAKEPFVRVVTGRSPEVNAVAGTMYVEIATHLAKVSRDGRRTVVVVSALDNLVKGGAGQAMQSFNLLLGLPETTGLDDRGLWP